MSNFWNEQYVKKARKDHLCMYCETRISKGNSYYRETGVYDGDFNFYKLCERCKLLIDNFAVDGEELGTFETCIHDNLSMVCPKCGYASTYTISEDNTYTKCKCIKCKHKWKEDLTLEGILDILHSI